MKMKLNRRILCAAGAALVALAMIVGGVFSWVDSSQHKTNVVTGGNLTEKNDAVLVEDYEEPDDWQLDDELKKEIWVKNSGDGQIYVRVQLKEYMDIAKVTYSYSEEYLLLDSDGRFVSANTAASLKAWLSANLPDLVYADGQIVSLRAYGESANLFYLATDETTNVNGKYGKRLLLDYEQAAFAPLMADAVRGGYETTDDHQNHPTAECLYAPHLWDGDAPDDCGQGECPDGFGFHDYVQWNLGADIILLSDWIALGAEPAPVWILDDVSDAKDAGWAYWGEALRPGDSTARLLESIKLVKQPDGPFYYAIHVDMMAADLYQLNAFFTGMPQEIGDAYRGLSGFAVTTATQSAQPGGSVSFKAALDGTELPAGDVTWSVANVSAAHLSTNTKFNAPGVLSVSGEQPAGRLLVTAAYNTGAGGVKTRQYVITVKPS